MNLANLPLGYEESVIYLSGDTVDRSVIAVAFAQLTSVTDRITEIKLLGNIVKKHRSVQKIE